jgi:hypothetical protein
MSKVKVCLSAIIRFAVLAGGLFFYTALLYSQAISCPTSNGTNIKQKFTAKDKSSDLLTEEFSFAIQDFKMNHQSQINNININFRYCYETGIADSKYPDFRALVKDIQDSLDNYPNEIDYWEIVNKNLTLMVLKKYPMLSSVTNEMQISPSPLVPFLRSSTVTRQQPKSIRTDTKKIG